jgi:hypothetical protein
MMENLEPRFLLTNPTADYPYAQTAGTLFHPMVSDLSTLAYTLTTTGGNNQSLQSLICTLGNEGAVAQTGVSLADIRQGNLGDCGLMAAIGEMVQRDPQAIDQMFEQMPDGTLNVTLAIPRGHGPYTVNMTTDLPAAAGQLYYNGVGWSVNDTSNVLWACYVEKAMAEAYGPGSYSGIAGFFPSEAWDRLIGKPTTFDDPTSDQAGFIAAWNSGQLICFVSPLNEPDPQVIPNHAFAVESYDAAAQTVTLFNPYGANWDITLTWNQIQADMELWDTSTT